MKKIITGISALYKQNIISYSPQQEHIEMLIGTNTTAYNSDKYKITLQSPKTFTIGTIQLDGENLYSPERLFIELNKFKMETTIKSEAIKNLEEIVNPEVVSRYYKRLQKHRRGLDNEYIVNFLKRKYVDIETLVKESKDKKSILREYIMAIVSKEQVPICLIKGGSSIELYTEYNRSTLDIDAHTDKDNILKILDILKDRDNAIYFIAKEDKQIKFEKKVVQIELIPKSIKTSLTPLLKDIIIPISFNTTYSDKELKLIISDYNIIQTRLKRIKNVSAIIFSKEMLLAEKYQSIISKPETSQRTKDLLDLFVLWDDKVNYNKLKKWFFKKWERNRIPKNHQEAIETVQENMDKELIKIKNNFSDSVSMYNISDVTFDKCLNIYKIITQIIIKED